MQKPELPLEKQRKMILRCIADLEDSSHMAFNNQDVTHFYTLESASQRFKEFIRESITIPQVLAAVDDIPTITEQPTINTGSRWGLLGVGFGLLMAKENARPTAETIRTAQVIMMHYKEMKRFVWELEV